MDEYNYGTAHDVVQVGPPLDSQQLMGGYKKESIKPFSGQEEISFSFEVLDGCSRTFSMDECTRYFKTPVDSCNCGGENGKQGGYGSNNCLRWKTDPNRSAY